MNKLFEHSLYSTPVYAGMELYVDDKMTGAMVKKSFKERFFSLPWKPWKAMKFDPNAGDPFIPDGQVIRLKGTNKIIMNSKTKRELEIAIKKENWGLK